MATYNRVQETRKLEALSIVELARRSKLSERTIRRVEDGQKDCSTLTKDKITRAFNTLSDKLQEYTFEYLFPNEAGNGMLKNGSQFQPRDLFTNQPEK